MTHDRAWTPLAHDKHDRARTEAGETEVGGGTAESEAERERVREAYRTVDGIRPTFYRGERGPLSTVALCHADALCTGVALRTSVVSHRGHGSRDTARVTRSVEGIHFPVPCSVPG